MPMGMSNALTIAAAKNPRIRQALDAARAQKAPAAGGARLTAGPGVTGSTLNPAGAMVDDYQQQNAPPPWFADGWAAWQAMKGRGQVGAGPALGTAAQGAAGAAPAALAPGQGMAGTGQVGTPGLAPPPMGAGAAMGQVGTGMAGSGGVTLLAPDGSIRVVPAEQEQFYLRLGAKRQDGANVADWWSQNPFQG